MVQPSTMKGSGTGTGGVGGVGCTTLMGLSTRESGTTTSGRGRDCSDWVRDWFLSCTFIPMPLSDPWLQDKILERHEKEVTQALLCGKGKGTIQGLVLGEDDGMFCVSANGNRYEGSWKNDMKNGDGKFFYLDRGQVYTGTWVDDTAKCGTLEDFGRETAIDPPIYPIPEVGSCENKV